MREGPPEGPWLLAVSGEASGSRLLAELPATLPRWGLFGDDVQALSASGTTEALARLPVIARAFRDVLHAARRRPPALAVLADFTEANAWLGRRLRAISVPVLWCVAPQVWAWRPRRASSLARSMDGLATLFAFEPPIFRRHGVLARWVGHPAADAPVGESARGRGIALLPGSRRAEVRALLPSLVDAVPRGEGTLLAAASLDRDTSRWAFDLALRAGHAVARVPEGGLVASLAGFDGALAAMGTATLECALANVPLVAVGRVSRLSAAILRGMLLTPHLALPNVVLARRAVPELVQDDVRPATLARALDRAVRAHLPLRDELLHHLRPPDGLTFGARTGQLAGELLARGRPR